MAEIVPRLFINSILLFTAFIKYALSLEVSYITILLSIILPMRSKLPKVDSEVYAIALLSHFVILLFIKFLCALLAWRATNKCNLCSIRLLFLKLI
jgi:hypothetical protein